MQDGRPVAYASRALTSTEQNYAQIEKELLAVCFGLERFHTYCYRHPNLVVETDHKPLISIFSKALSNAPRRLQRMMLRLQNYSFSLKYKPGAQVIFADTLSRAYPKEGAYSESQQFSETVAAVNDLSTFEIELQRDESLQLIIASESLKNELVRTAQSDPVVAGLKTFLRNGWPDERSKLPDELREFYTFRDELVMENGILFKGTRIYVPAESRDNVTERIHSSHIGLQGCLRRAREAVFWPGMVKDITKLVTSCSVCAKVQSEQSKEPLMPHELPDRPWQRVGCDLFEFNNYSYMITVDYYSNFFEVDRLSDKKAPEIIRHLKAHFARWGCPELLCTDNGPPFNSSEFRRFSTLYEFEHRTSSPRYPQSNGKSENAVRTVKRLMQKALEAHSDPYLALLDLRNTPSESFGESPAQRLLGRRVRTRFPIDSKLLDVPGAKKNKRCLKKAKEKQAKYFNRRAHEKPTIPVHQTVRAKINQETGWVKAEVIEQLPYRSYRVETESGRQFRRNRKDLRFSNESPIIKNDVVPDTTSIRQVEPPLGSSSSATLPQQQSPPPLAAPLPRSATPQAEAKIVPRSCIKPLDTVTRSGRLIKPPVRFSEYVAN